MFYTSNGKNNPLTALLLHYMNNNILARDYLMSSACYVLKAILCHCLCSSTALCFTCAWYSSIVTGGLLHLLLVQVINISYNVTEREARLALRDKTARSAYCGLVVDTGVYSRGFSGNWAEFMTMGEQMNASPALTDMV